MSPAGQPISIRLDVKIPMRDGVLLSADIYTPPGGGPFPVLLVRTIYDKQQERYVEWTERFVEAGYACVMQDCRGRNDSDGAWEPYIHEADDGHDTIEWIGEQPWCDGSVGMYGISYVGFTQHQPATRRSKYLKAITPIASQQDNFGHQRFDGVLQQHVAQFFINMAGRTNKRSSTALMNWDDIYSRLPLVSAVDDIVDLEFYREVVRHHTFDDFWKSYSMRDKYGEVAVPAYLITGWYDNLVHETCRLFQGWTAGARTEEARRLTKLLIGPWSHRNIGSSERFGSIDFGGNAFVDIVDEQIRWNDRRLKGIDNGMDNEPKVRVFVMGANRWRTGDTWPLEDVESRDFYLQSSRGANSIYGDGRLSDEPPGDGQPDEFTYDPNDPVPTIGGQFMMMEMGGPADRRPAQRRDDVLVYDYGPLEADLEVVGPVTLTLLVSSSAPDTDFTGTLSDVYPDGKAVMLTEGIARARFRESIEEPVLMEPGGVYEISVDMWETGNLFRAGPHDSPGGLQQQLPALRTQPEHRLTARTRRRRGDRPADYIQGQGQAVAPDPARHSAGLTRRAETIGGMPSTGSLRQGSPELSSTVGSCVGGCGEGSEPCPGEFARPSSGRTGGSSAHAARQTAASTSGTS